MEINGKIKPVILSNFHIRDMRGGQKAIRPTTEGRGYKCHTFPLLVNAQQVDFMEVEWMPEVRKDREVRSHVPKHS